MVAALEDQLGQGIVVRSDDVDGNEVSGVVTTSVGEHAYRVRFTDSGEVVTCAVDRG